jgi:hypothetical protein
MWRFVRSIFGGGDSNLSNASRQRERGKGFKPDVVAAEVDLRI